MSKTESKFEAFASALQHTYGYEKRESIKSSFALEIKIKTSASGEGNGIFITFKTGGAAFLSEMFVLAAALDISYLIKPLGDKVQIEFYK